MTWEYKVNAVQPWVVASSGTKIYVLKYVNGRGGDDIYEYDPATNDWTLILDLSAFDATAVRISGLVWFNGNLYFGVFNANVSPTPDEFNIYAWDGTPNNATLVDTISVDGIDFGRLLADDSVMVAYIVKPAASPGSSVRYTADGATWSNGSFSTYTPREPSNVPWADIPPDAGYDQGIYVQCSTDHSGADSTRDTLFIWSTNTFAPVTEFSFYTYLGGDPVTTDLLWTYAALYYSTDFLENRTAATGNAITHCRQINMPWQPGLGVEVSDTALYQYDGAGVFDYVEDFAPGVGSGWNLGEDLDVWLVRLTSGMTYILSTETGTYSGAYVILERSDPIDPPSAFAEFWQGTNGPGAAKKSDLPFTGINNPSCLVVRDNAAVTVFIGGLDTGAEMVVTGSNADDYAAWTDITDSLSTAKPINGLVNI